MSDEFRHKDAVAGKIFEDEYEHINQHILNNGVEGDFIYWDAVSGGFKRIAHATLTATHGVSGTIADADDLIAHEAALDPHLVETLPVLLKGGNLLHIPTNAGWTSTVVGTGYAGEEIFNPTIATGTDPNSKGMLVAHPRLFSLGIPQAETNWDKKTYLIFNFSRTASDSEVIARYQLKSATIEGAMSAKGIGIRVDNYVLKGESYGTELGVVDLATTLVPGQTYQVFIIHYPANKIEWYVNGILKGTQNTAGRIPSGNTILGLVFSIVNGASGGVPASSWLGQPKIWQEA